MALQADRTVVREPAEQRSAEELAALKAADKDPRPPGWQLSPKAVRTFIIGSDGRKLPSPSGQPIAIPRKLYGDDMLVDRCVVTLMGNRGLILIGEPGTAKTMLSELLSAAICGQSTNTIQGTAGTTEDQIKYSWNYALLLAEGPSPRALVPSPLYIGLKEGLIVRFEEMTRCPQEIQDTLVSILSDKMMQVPELGDGHSLVLAKKGFNIIATANTRDRGVNEMSSALKRRFNFETVRPIRDKDFEVRLVMEQAQSLLADAGAQARIEQDVVDMLVTAFQDLRNGRTAEGTVVDRPSTPMSTAEAVSVAFSAALDACYLGDGRVRSEHLVRQLLGTVIKDSPDDAKKVRQYFDVVVKSRLRLGSSWRSFYEARGLLDV
ncbi:MAG: AAA family ATPase [Verrucomicrobia bacterium]|nr:AAA family ATPase [Verrucomicrobiota bacterium]